MQKKSILAIAIVIILAIAMLLAYLAFAPKAQAGAKQITIIVNHLAGAAGTSEPAKTQTTYNLQTDAKYLREALEENDLAQGPETEYGLWIQTVDGETADESKQEWWGYTVNGEFAAYGVDQQVVTDGDIYEFTLNQGY